MRTTALMAVTCFRSRDTFHYYLVLSLLIAIIKLFLYRDLKLGRAVVIEILNLVLK